MKELKTMIYSIHTEDKLIQYFRTKFDFNNKNIRNEVKSYLDEQILSDISAIHFNIIEFDNDLKATKYIKLLSTMYASNHKILGRYGSLMDGYILSKEDEKILSVNSTGNIITENKENDFQEIILELEIIEILLNSLNKLNLYIANLISELSENIPTESKTNIKIDKILVPLFALNPVFSALIDCGLLLDEKFNKYNKTNASKLLCKHFVFLNKKNLPYEESVVSKFISSDYDPNKHVKFYNAYNCTIDTLEKPIYLKKIEP